jgi:prepilin-type N-terminal cleavage/methylation domain-containing protein
MSVRSAIPAGRVAPKFRGRRSRGGLVALNPSGLAGFTLLEIIVVLALFGLISALMVGGSGALLRASSREDVATVTLGAVAAARHEAVLAGRIVDLRVDEKARALDWGGGRAPLAGSDRVKLLPPERIGAILLGGRLEETAIPRVRFYPDGTCDPFRLEILRTESREVLVIDPWTCTVIAPDAKSRTR